MRFPGLPRPPEGADIRLFFVLWECVDTWFFWARCWPKDKRMELYLRVYLLAPPLIWAAWRWWAGAPGWWRSPLWAALAILAVLLLALYLALKHELGHVLGLPQGCAGGHPWCVMAEEELVGERDGSVWGKIKLLGHQVLKGWGRYCPECREVVERYGGWD